MDAQEATTAAGPLAGLRVVEFAGIGPAPFCAMLLADMGAEVLRIERPGGGVSDPVVDRGRASLLLDLKSAAARDTCLDALERADVLIEGFRPGVMERLGLGPGPALARNPRLIYGRMTGWGQTGPLAPRAGHDITYIALTGALEAIGPADGAPTPPLNLVGDYGGGALYLALGITAALVERGRSGRGQVIDAAVVDGAASLMSLFHGLGAAGVLQVERGRNLLGGAAPNYRTYRCSDGRHLAVGALEPQFHAELRRRLGLPPAPASRDPADWPAQAAELAAVFAQAPRDHWAALLEGLDACAAPVLAMDEAPDHPHMRERGVYVERDGVRQPAPAPRFSRTPSALAARAPAPGEGGRELLARWGAPTPPGPENDGAA